MKKIICYLLLSALLINVALNSNAFKIYGAEPCSDCTVAPSKVINEWVDESGNEVKMFEENVEVTYLENDAIIIRDYVIIMIIPLILKAPEKHVSHGSRLPRLYGMQ